MEHIKFSFLYKISLSDRFESHEEVIDELTCFCTKGGSFLAVSSVAGEKEDPLLSYWYSSYIMKYCDPIPMW